MTIAVRASNIHRGPGWSLRLGLGDVASYKRDVGQRMTTSGVLPFGNDSLKGALLNILVVEDDPEFRGPFVVVN